MEKKRPSFSIIIPVFNEEAIIVNSINQNIEVIEKSGVSYEVVVVNDASKDNSLKLIEDNFKNCQNVKIHSHTKNKGFGGAVRTGIFNSIYDFLLCVPVDSPLTNSTFFAFLEAAPKADVVVSYRVARLGYSLSMRLNSWVYHVLIEYLFGIHLVDFNWIHLYNRRIFDKGGIVISSDGIFMLAEVLILAKRKGFSFCEIPVIQTERITGVASASKISVIFATLSETIRFYIRTKGPFKRMPKY